MTVSTNPRTRSYVEDGVTLAFSAPFKFNGEAGLLVERITSAGVTELPAGSAWSATGGTTDAGGTVTLVSTVAGATLRITGKTSRAQQTDYATGDTFPAETHEAALDRLSMVDQEQDVAIGDVEARALRVPVGESVAELPSASLRSGLFLGFDGDGAPIATSGATVGEIMDLPTYLGPVANNCCSPNWMMIPGGAIKRLRGRSIHYLNEDVTGLVLGFPHWFINSITGYPLIERYDNPPGGWSLQALVRMVQIRTFPATLAAVAKFGGAINGTVQPGDTQWTDMIPVSLTKGTKIAIEQTCWHADGTNPRMPAKQYSAIGDYAVHGTAIENDPEATPLVNLPDPNVLWAWSANSYEPARPCVYVLGVTRRGTVSIIGNSVDEGSQDELAGTPFGDVGTLQRAMTSLGVSYINLSYGNDSFNEWLGSNSRRLPLAKLCPRVLIGSPANDLGRLNRSAAQAAADANTIAGMISSTGRRVDIITSPPISTTSTDGFTTTANQTPHPTLGPKVTAYNALIRAGLSNVNGRVFDVADVLMTARDSNIWKTSGTTPWTTDGLHPLPIAYRAIESSGIFRLPAWDIPSRLSML